MRAFATILVLGMMGGSASAEEWTPAFPSPTWQKVADIASYGTLGAGLAMETWDAFHCADHQTCLLHEGYRLGLTWGVTFGLKTIVKRMRPCAPSCGIDSPDSSFPSGHSAFAGQTVEGSRRTLKAILAGSTATLRVAANRHHPSDVAAGFAIGWSTTVIW